MKIKKLTEDEMKKVVGGSSDIGLNPFGNFFAQWQTGVDAPNIINKWKKRKRHSHGSKS